MPYLTACPPGAILNPDPYSCFAAAHSRASTRTYPVQDETSLVSLEVAHVCNLQAETLPEVPLPGIHHHHALPPVGRHLLQGSLHLQDMWSISAGLTKCFCTLV